MAAFRRFLSRAIGAGATSANCSSSEADKPTRDAQKAVRTHLKHKAVVVTTACRTTSQRVPIVKASGAGATSAKAFSGVQRTLIQPVRQAPHIPLPHRAEAATTACRTTSQRVPIVKTTGAGATSAKGSSSEADKPTRDAQKAVRTHLKHKAVAVTTACRTYPPSPWSAGCRDNRGWRDLGPVVRSAPYTDRSLVDPGRPGSETRGLRGPRLAFRTCDRRFGPPAMRRGGRSRGCRGGRGPGFVAG
jgi:hypothetical protein